MKEDKELYKQFLNGDMDAFNELMTRYRTEVVYFIQKYIGDYYSSEDVSQEVFIYILQHKEVYKFEYSFKTYLYTIAKSRALNFSRRHKKVDFIEDNVDKLFHEIKFVEDEVFKNADSEMVRKVIKKLKKNYQIAIHLIDLNDFSYDEAGMVLGKSASQVKALIHNARKRLKVFLEEERLKEVKHDEINGGIHK